MMFLSQKITAAFNLTVHGALPVSDLLQISPKKSGAAEPHQQSDKGTKMPWLHRRSPTSCLRGWFNVRYFRTGIQGRGLNMVTWFYMILRSTKQYMGIWSDMMGYMENLPTGAQRRFTLFSKSPRWPWSRNRSADWRSPGWPMCRRWASTGPSASTEMEMAPVREMQ